MKYYCRSGGFRMVLDARDPEAAARTVVKKALDAMRDDGPALSLLLAVSERGFDDDDAILAPVIPLAKELGSAIGASGSELARRYGIDASGLDSATRRWLLGD